MRARDPDAGLCETQNPRRVASRLGGPSSVDSAPVPRGSFSRCSHPSGIGTSLVEPCPPIKHRGCLGPHRYCCPIAASEIQEIPQHNPGRFIGADLFALFVRQALNTLSGHDSDSPVLDCKLARCDTNKRLGGRVNHALFSLLGRSGGLYEECLSA